MDTKQYDYIKNKIQQKIDELEALEDKFAELKDYPGAYTCQCERIAYGNAWKIIIDSEDPNKVASF